VFILGIALLLSLSSLWIHNNVVNQSANESTPIEILLIGDVMLGRTVMTKSMDLNDFTYPFQLVADQLRAADITFINLENPIIENCPRSYDGFVFCAKPEMVEGLTNAGVDIVNVANNHALNYGAVGLEETQKILSSNKIDFTGLGELLVKDINGTRFGFIGFDKSQQEFPVFNDKETALIVHSNEQVDILIVSMHWGFEYQAQAHSSQIQLAETLVNLGADVIVGHHPHWVQNIDYIEGVPVYYSLGNFIFDQMFEEKVREGLVIKLIFQNKKIIFEERISAYMENWAQPRWQFPS
jgi:poly-gamma-glutamate synthesis protein (capsule biosynthesis protein)